MSDPIVVVGAKRTPIGAFLGRLSPVCATALGATALRAAVAESGVSPDDIDEVYLGCVLPAGLGQAPARQAALAAGLSLATPCTAVSKVCGSGMKAVMLGAQSLSCGDASIVATGGMESMSNAPHLLPKSRAGYRYGHQRLVDHMAFDGLESPWDGKAMGHFADQTAMRLGFTREAMEAYSMESVRRAVAASREGRFASEIAPVRVHGRSGEEQVAIDETPFVIDVSRFPKQRPAFNADGRVTAGTSSSISDGAAAVVLMAESQARRSGTAILGRIVSMASHAGEPAWFTTAPEGAIKSVLERAGWSIGDVDLFEINEAFAVVTMAAMQSLGIPREKVNVHGGAVALGHPIGATGARIIVTLLHALRQHGLHRGVASLCIGGGEATAIAFELT